MNFLQCYHLNVCSGSGLNARLLITHTWQGFNVNSKVEYERAQLYDNISLFTSYYHSIIMNLKIWYSSCMAYVQRLLRTSHLFKSHLNFFLLLIVHFAKSLLNHWADLDDKYHGKSFSLTDRWSLDPKEFHFCYHNFSYRNSD